MAGSRLLIAPVDITAEAFAPFGTVVDAASVKPEAINEGTTMRHSDLAVLDLGKGTRDPAIGIYVASARRFPRPSLRRRCRAGNGNP
jgi:ureidoglycolate lyase